MSNLLETIDSVLLMGPGPSSVDARVYKALAKPTIGHLDPQFLVLMDSLKENLKKVMGTTNEATIALSGTGSSGMEAVLTNLVEEGESMLVVTNGYFAERMIEVARRLGAQVDSIEFPAGKPVIVAEVAKKLKEKSYKLVGMIHGETSTGVLNPIGEIGPLVRAADAYFIVDAVTSLGGNELHVDEYQIDALYSCSQKCLGCPSGLSPVTFSPRAMEKIEKRKKKVPNFYLDMTLLMKYWSGSPRVYHHTAPANMYYALYEALFLILEEGVENVWARHKEAHEYFVAGIEKMGLSLMVEKPWRLPNLNTVLIPAGVDDAAVRKELRQTYKIAVGSGLGSMAGKIWRVGIMGHNARKESVDKLLDTLKKILGK
ncbi:alanine--glyoxylate aminotransferase family protein [Treponema sp. OttesenSCG-928-L16]|nr:alanine--glyoxylate aminotransferase family protein [Treponema sp. OttesenSCG-928-L16]